MPVARSWSRTNATRFEAARGSHAHCSDELPLGRLVRQQRELAAQLPDGASELGRPADLIALPERDRSRHAGSGGDEDPVARDLLDPPRARPEQEHLTLARLVDHLLVELADAPRAVHQEHAEEPAVRDRPGVRDRDADRSVACTHGALDAVPHEAGPQLGELVGGVAPGEQIEHAVELAAGQIAVRVGALHQGVEIVDRDGPLRARAHELLREDVERVPRDARLLDQPLAHASRDDRALEEIGAELREDAPPRGLAHLVARTADALQATRDRSRRLDLADEVDGAHVDAELERRGGDEARQGRPP